jgi:hypothetical protein
MVDIAMLLSILICWLLLGSLVGLPLYLVCRYEESRPTDDKERRRRRNRQLSRIFWPVWGTLWLGTLAVVLPELGRAHEPARRANCLSNLKQIGLAIAMYADMDPHRRCPTDGDPPTLIGSLRLLSNVVSTTKILRCPSDWRARGNFDFDGMMTTNISYSYVPNLIWQDHPDSIVALDRMNDTAGGSRWPKTGNHGDNGGNVLFSDGRVVWTNTLPSALKDKDGKQIVLSP